MPGVLCELPGAFETRCLTELASQRALGMLRPLAPCLQTPPLCVTFYIGSGNLNSDLPSCLAVTLGTGSSFQLLRLMVSKCG